MCDSFSTTPATVARANEDSRVKNAYFPDDQWDRLRKSLAATILMREAAKLMNGEPTENTHLIEAALEDAAMQMAETGLMPECTREAVAA